MYEVQAPRQLTDVRKKQALKTRGLTGGTNAEQEEIEECTCKHTPQLQI